MILAYNKLENERRKGLMICESKDAMEVCKRVGDDGTGRKEGRKWWRKREPNRRSAIVIVLSWSKLFSVMLYSNCTLRDFKWAQRGWKCMRWTYDWASVKVWSKEETKRNWLGKGYQKKWRRWKIRRKSVEGETISGRISRNCTDGCVKLVERGREGGLSFLVSRKKVSWRLVAG